MASTGLSKTFSSSPTNNKKGTMSFWMKKSAVSSGQQAGLLVAGASGGTAGLYFDGDGKLYWYLAYTGSWQGSYTTNRQFRDPNSWYHIVQSWDTTQSTESERMKLYVNVVQETSFSSISYPPQNQVTTFGNATAHYINYWGNASYFDGSMSHFHYTDGYAYAASDFGSFDSTTGEWKINTNPSVTYGTNGFWILKDGMSLTDASPNSNDWAVSTGTLTKTEDNPSNVFATLNPLLDTNNPMILSNGNTTATGSGSGNHRFSGANICVSSGKYYYEVKVTKASSSPYCGIIDAQSTLRRNGVYFVAASSGDNDSGYAVNMSGDIYHNNSSTYATSIGSISTGDILGFAVDLDSAQRTCTIYKNGTSMRTFNIAAPSSGFYMLGCCSAYNEASAVAQFNFGNGYFGSTQISSAGTNASGIGIFEYDVPTGYTALSTKGLNE